MTLNCTFLAFSVLSEQGIYISRVTGNDTKTCGHVSSPCRTIPYGIQQLSTGLYIYLDGTDTLENPYPCESSDPRYPVITIMKNVSFVSIKSRAHISCREGNGGIANGLGHKHGIRISFSGLTFLDTSIGFFDASVAADDVVFANSKLETLRFSVLRSSRVDLSLNNVVFQNNVACIDMDSKKGKIFVKITNTVFYQNGNLFSSVSSILSVYTFSSINIQLINCSFEKNTLKGSSMISVYSAGGTTNVLLKQLKLNENGQICPSIKKCNDRLFRFESTRLFFRLEYGFIYKTSGTFLNVINGQFAEINISDTEIDQFHSDSRGGGVVNIVRLDSCSLLIVHSSFRNGNTYGPGGVFSIVAKNAKLTIQNSTIHNISCSNSGGAVFIQSNPNDYRRSTNRKKHFFVLLRIINSSFSYSSSTKDGGALCVFTQMFAAIIRDSLFLQCKAASGGALFFDTNSNTTINLNSSYFLKNSADAGGALSIAYKQNEPVLFIENATIRGFLTVADVKLVFTNCTFLNNFALFQGGLIVITGTDSINLSLFHSLFRQTIKQLVFSTKKRMATSFLRLFSPNKLTIINTTFDQQTISDDPMIFVPAAENILIDNASLSICPLGHRIGKTSYGFKGADNDFRIGLSFSCKECDYNFYSFQRGTARGLIIDDVFQCLSCPRGADCVPAINSKTNYWGYHTSSNPPKLAFTICPFGYCKSPPTNSTEYNACQGKRTGVMCGMCSQGYTEALWSSYCTPVKDCNDYWFWILFLALIFSMAILLVFKPPFVTYCLKQILWFKISRCTSDAQAYHDIVPSFSLDDETPQENIALSSTEQLKQDKRQFSRVLEIIFYFCQIAQLLLSSSSLKEFFDSQFLKPVLGFFNFQPSFTKFSFFCPFPGLSPATKLVFKISPVLGTLIAIFFTYTLHSITSHMRGAIRPAIAPYLQASIKTIFLGYATMATVSISLIRCVFVADESRWFYNGNITCYQWWQYASLAFTSSFVIPFIFVLAVVSFKLHHNRITVRQFLLAIIFPLPFLMLWLLRFACSTTVANLREENQNVEALKEMLLAPYRQPDDTSKRGALYWQSVLIARRFLLVLIFCTVTEPSVRLFCMTLACAFAFGCHLKLRPFQNSCANNLESVSLFFLIILGLVNLFKSVFVGSEQNIKGSLITVLKVFQWLETLMLGLFPAALLLLLSFAVISFSLRVLFVCCKSIFKFLFRLCVQRWTSRHSTPLLNVCDIADDLEEYLIN